MKAGTKVKAAAAAAVFAYFAGHAGHGGHGPHVAGHALSVASEPVSTGGNVATGREMAAARGWAGAQWNCLNALWTRESGWQARIWNTQGSGAYGIPQALPASKMASAGPDYMTNPVTQIRWGLGYIRARYGTPCGAWAHETADSWY